MVGCLVLQHVRELQRPISPQMCLWTLQPSRQTHHGRLLVFLCCSPFTSSFIILLFYLQWTETGGGRRMAETCGKISSVFFIAADFSSGDYYYCSRGKASGDAWYIDVLDEKNYFKKRYHINNISNFLAVANDIHLLFLSPCSLCLCSYFIKIMFV